MKAEGTSSLGKKKKTTKNDGDPSRDAAEGAQTMVSWDRRSAATDPRAECCRSQKWIGILK